MSVIPSYFGSGIVGIYGLGSADSVEGMTPPDGFFWGSIYQLGDTSWPYPQIGDNVLFNSSEIVCRLSYTGATNTGTYTLIRQQGIIATEQIPEDLP
jgi:hypothetical protein